MPGVAAAAAAGDQALWYVTTVTDEFHTAFSRFMALFLQTVASKKCTMVPTI